MNYESAQRILDVKNDRRLRARQHEARTRKKGRVLDDRNAVREEYYRRLLSAEEEYSRAAWAEEERIEQEKKDKKSAIAAATLLQDIIDARHVALGLGLDVQTPGITGLARMQLLQTRIANFHRKNEIKATSELNFRKRRERQPHLEKEIRAYSIKMYTSKMVIAVEKRKMDHVLHMVENGADPNTESVSGRTAVINAIQRAQYTILRTLAHSASVNFETSNGNTPLLVAIERCDELAVDILIELGALLDLETKFGTTPLLYAIDLNRESMVKKLLLAGVNVNKKSKLGHIALCQAAKRNQLDIARLLMRYGANTYLRGEGKRTASEVAKLYNYNYFATVIATAISRGTLKPEEPLTYEEKQEKRKIETAKASYRIALQQESLVDILQVLDKERHVVQPNMELGDGRTALLVSLRCGVGIPYFHALITRGCIPSQLNKDGRSVLMEAVLLNRMDIVSLILTYISASPSSTGSRILPESPAHLLYQRDIDDMTPLLILQKNVKPDLASFLMRFGPKSYGSKGARILLSCPINTTSSSSDGNQEKGPIALCIQTLRNASENISAQHAADTLEQQFKDDAGHNNTKEHETIKGHTSLAVIPSVLTPEQMWKGRQHALKHNGVKKEAFDKERLKQLRYMQKGRRGGFLVNNNKAIGQWKLPHCQQCHLRFARKRCLTCCRIYCDQCSTRLHLVPERRHHSHVEVEPKRMLDGVEYAIGLQARENTLAFSVTQSSAALEEIKQLLVGYKTPSPPWIPQDMEIIRKTLQGRTEQEKIERDEALQTQGKAAQKAKERGMSVFDSPGEIEFATFLMGQERYEEAGECLETALAVQEKAFGRHHPHVALTMQHQATLLQAAGKYEDSIELSQEVLRILEDTLSLGHEHVVTAVNQLITTMIVAEKLNEAVILCRQIRVLRSEALGSRHALVQDATEWIEKLIGMYENQQLALHDPVSARRIDLEVNGKRYALEKIGMLPEQLRSLLLERPEETIRFETFAKSEKVNHYISFWVNVDKFKKLKRGSEPFKELAREVYMKHIKSKTLRCLTAEIRNRIRRMYTTPAKKMPSSIFKQAEELVFETMQHGVYTRYLNTPEGRKWLRDYLLHTKYSKQLVSAQQSWRRALFRRRHVRGIEAIRKQKKLEKLERKKKKAKKAFKLAQKVAAELEIQIGRETMETTLMQFEERASSKIEEQYRRQILLETMKKEKEKKKVVVEEEEKEVIIEKADDGTELVKFDTGMDIPIIRKKVVVKKKKEKKAKVMKKRGKVGGKK